MPTNETPSAEAVARAKKTLPCSCGRDAFYENEGTILVWERRPHVSSCAARYRDDIALALDGFAREFRARADEERGTP